ncbi:MAG: hypothetical protein K2K34_07095 [Oscillospiraceae bacterium]|nr:hypothetical protein [Oscillospiraceae bacterium]
MKAKKLAALILAVLCTSLVGCTDTNDDIPVKDVSLSEIVLTTETTVTNTATVMSTSEVTATSYTTETSPIVMVILYENYAWGEEQEIKIIDSNGSYYYFSDEQEQDNLIWFDFNEKDWYNTLCDIAKSGNVTELSDEELKAILDFSEKYEADLTKKYKEYESPLRDFGSYFLYGIYNDGGKPKYVLLSQYGNGIKCLDDEAVISFVNQMIDFGIFPTAHHKDFHY